jgi:hypothetical protein
MVTSTRRDGPVDATKATQRFVAVLEGLSAQLDLSSLLGRSAAAGWALGTPWYLACLLRDEATGAWYLTALLDPAGEPLELARLRAPTGPFSFQPPHDVGLQLLPALLGAAWGPVSCETLAEALGVSYAACAVIPGSDEARGALIGLVTEADSATPLLAGVLLHAGSVASRLLPPPEVAPGTRILSFPVLADRTAVELARAKRYGRPLSLVSVLVPPESEPAAVGDHVARMLRQWDFLGGVHWNRPWQIDSARPRFAAVLPETTAASARGFLGRLAPRLPDCRFGVATFPADGATFEALLTRACGTAEEICNWLPVGEAELATRPARPAGRRSWWRRSRSSD